jgi:hypothetical protein
MPGYVNRVRFSTKQTMAFAVVAISACKSNDPGPGPIFETGDDGITAPDVDLPSGETGEEPGPVALPTGECVQYPKPEKYYGFVHQCEGRAKLSYQAKSESGSYSFTFGPGAKNPSLWVRPDSYALPLVAACCGRFNYENPTFEQKLPYLNNCLIDTVQQTCHGIPHLLRRAAEQADSLAKKLALKAFAKQVESREDECVTELWAGGATEDYPNRLLERTWTPKKGVSITLVDAEVTDWTVEGEVDWNTCTSMYDNDPAVVPSAPYQVPGVVAMTQTSLAPGTAMSGSGPGGSHATIHPSSHDSSLTVAYLPDGTLLVTGLLLEAESVAVTVFGVEGQLDHSSMVLGNVLEPRLIGGEYTVDTDSASFVVTATFEGGSRTVMFTNVDPITFRETMAGAWEFDPFDLAYAEPGLGTWVLSFEWLRFEPHP